jgi:tetratricopeptide (TPR) repeat protein
MKKLGRVFLLIGSCLFFACWGEPGFSLSAQGDNRLDSLQQLLKKTEVDSVKVNLLLALSVESQLSDYRASLRYALQAVEAAEKSTDKRLLAGALKEAGRNCQRMGLTGQAAHYYVRHLEAVKDTNDNRVLGYAYFNIGAIRLILEDYESAELNINKAYGYLRAHARASNEPMPANEVLGIYNNLGLIYTGKKDTASAAEAFRKGIAYYRKENGPKVIVSQIMCNYGKLLQDQDKTSDALPLFEEVVAIEKSINHSVGMAVGLMYQGNAYVDLGNYTKAESLLQQANQLVDDQVAYSFKKYISQSLYDLYQKTGQVDSALRYLNLVNENTRQLKLEEASNELIRQELSAVFDEKVEQLEKTNTRRQSVYTIAIVISCVLLVGLWVIYLRSRKKSAAILQEQQDLAASKSSIIEQEKEQLKNEIEHRDKVLVTQSIKEIQQHALITDILQQLVDEQEKSKLNRHKLTDLASNMQISGNEKLWNEFEIRFQQVDVGFYKRLQEKFPGLTPNERKLCAFLRLNLSSKEISSITGQSNHSIMVARTRLRKKLELTNKEIGLVEFIALI